DRASGRFWEPLPPRGRDRRARDVDEDLRVRHAWRMARVHADLLGQRVALAAVAGRARRDDVLPGRGAALRAGDDVVDGEVGARAAVLAGPAVAREDGSPGDLA